MELSTRQPNDVAEPSRRSSRPRKLAFSSDAAAGRLTHHLFRFPAKFHPPVVRALLERYTEKGSSVLDPFCGSGTLLVEATISGRRSTGTDVDPLAVFVSAVKAHPLNGRRLESHSDVLFEGLDRWRRPTSDYEQFQHGDISDEQFAAEAKALTLPAIPNLGHWFRRYVTIDLARIRDEILSLEATAPQRRFFLLCFASIIRAASNADPVPVSGLEVTAYMKKRDEAGRVINPFALFEATARRGIRDMGLFYEAADRSTAATAYQANATELTKRVRRRYDATITSPPYHGAVDYYRRHQLEMFWLGLTKSQSDRLELLDGYIGRPRVPERLPLMREVLTAAKCVALERRIRGIDPIRANAFKHYSVAMQRTFQHLARILPFGAPAVFVVGHSSWNGDSLNTSDLFAELAKPFFEREEWLFYPVKNRYMSYSRHNGASIDREYVLVMRRTRSQP